MAENNGINQPHQGKGKKVKKPAFNNPRDMVTFYIRQGDEQEVFIVHKEFVCHYSPVFKAAFNSQFIEGQTQTYKFDDTTPDAFKLLVQWLYGQSFDLKAGSEQLELNEEDDVFERESETLCQLWILADKLRIPRLQNLAIDELRRISDEENLIAVESLRGVYERTSVNSPLRQFFVRQLALEAERTSYFTKAYVYSYPPEFYIDLAFFMRGVIKKKEKDEMPKSMDKFHVAEETTGKAA